MKQGNGVGRRTFLKNVALTGGLAARDENATEQKRGADEERASKSTISYPRVYSGRRLSTVAFPLGGVGTGCISLGGRGQLRDWEIYNRSDKGKMPQYAFAWAFKKACMGSSPSCSRAAADGPFCPSA